MAIRMYLAFVVWCWYTSLVAQADQSIPEQKEAWQYNAAINAYAFSDALIINPVITADWKALHLEGRYNYEDVQTASLFAGYTINAGKKFTMELTPMLGVALGQTDGIIPALELNLAYGAFNWYNESEYLLNTSGGDHFFYAWSEFTYYPLDWLMIGLATARTKLYETELTWQRGFGLGYVRDQWNVTGYLMNLGFDESFFYFSVAMQLP